MSKVSVIAKLTVQEGKLEEVLSALSEVVKATADEPGTEVYVLNTDNADPNTVWFYELYTDAEAVTAHNTSPTFQAAGGKLATLLAGRPELYTLTPVQSKGVALV
jgi:quinol monooxygenase YgiN